MENFIKFIEEEEESIRFFQNALQSPDTSQERFPDIYNGIYLSFLEKTIALFSMGAKKEIVKGSLIGTVLAFKNGFDWKGFDKSYGMYDELIWLLSLGILCDLDDEYFRQIVEVAIQGEIIDTLTAALINFRFPGEVDGSSFIQKTPYEFLIQIITKRDKNVSNVKRYLDNKWYQGHRQAYWYDSHNNKKLNTYFGYWAWEIGALVKMLQIEDAELKNQKYYPYRAVHW